MLPWRTVAIPCLVGLGLVCCGGVWADEPATETPPAANGKQLDPGPGPVAPDDKQLEGLIRVSRNHDVWVDTKRKFVVVDGKICLREGQLEMFACTPQSKEHESVVSCNTLAFLVHAALLRVGAKEGTPVKFSPKYVPATGTEIEIFALWRDKDGKPHKVRAQEWIRNVKTQKPMEYNWVFAGSGFFLDEETGKQHYLAEGGELICVSNFPTATLDLAVRSTDANAELLFEAFTEKIPPLATPVRLILVPKLEKPADQPAEKPMAPVAGQ